MTNFAVKDILYMEKHRRYIVSGSLLFRPGVLAKEQIRDLIKRGILKDVSRKNIDESSFDLTLSDECYRLPYAVKPRKGETYRDVLKPKFKYEPTKGEFHLERNTPDEKRVYIFRLNERVNFNGYEQLYGLATGKSSLGRLDLLVRLIADDEKADCYDYVPSTQTEDSPLYVEIIPITFDVIVKKGFAISQLRLFVGEPELNKISDRRLENIYKSDLLRKENGDLPPKKMKFSKRLTVNLKPDKNIKGSPCAFVALKDTEPIDLPELDKELRKAKRIKGYKPRLLAPKKYWEPVSPKGQSLPLTRESFYILRSCERLYIPGHVCVGCEAVKEELGELRIHYAGFAHPGFGRKRGKGDEKGTPLIFEVRGHNFDTCLRHGEALAVLEFYNMSEEIQVDKSQKSDYDRQELKLSKYFKEW